MSETETKKNYAQCEKCGYTLFTQIDRITFDCQRCNHRNSFIIK